MPERHADLRDERDEERTARVARALQSAGVGQRDGDEEARHAQVAQQLRAERDDDRIRAGRRARAAGSRRAGRSRRSSRRSSGRSAPPPAPPCTLRSGRPAPRFCPAIAAAAPIRPTDVHVMNDEELGVADRVRRLRLGAVRERAHEAQQQDAGDVHRHALHAGRQPEAEQRADDLPVGTLAARRAKLTTTRPVAISQMPTPDASADAIDVPSAAPCAPNAGIGPTPRIRTMFSATFSPTIHMPMRSAGPRVARRAQRAGDHEIEQLPDAAHEHRPQVRQRVGAAPPATRGRASSSDGEATQPIGAEHAERRGRPRSGTPGRRRG